MRNSRSQLAIVESGAMIRNGPLIPVEWISSRNVIDWMVFPKPISSAKIQLRLRETDRESTQTIKKKNTDSIEDLDDIKVHVVQILIYTEKWTVHVHILVDQ